MLIDASHPEETRVAMVRGNRVEEFDFESEHKRQIRGNIYLAKVTRVEPSLQAAFVDYGGNRHGFLAFNEIHPDYYQIPLADRQALLEAEAEDARAAADQENSDDDGDAEEVEAAEAPAKKPRRRRTSRKKTDASPETTSEESDDSGEEMNAENEGDDVVSEPAEEKPRRTTRRRTSRKKAEPEEAAEEEAPKPRKRRSRAKKVTAEADVDVTAEAAVSAESTDDEEEAPKPKRRRRSTRRKASDEDSGPEATAEEASAEANDSAGEEEKPAAKPRRARRSRRSKADDKNDNGSDDETADTPTPVETGGGDDGIDEARPPRRSNRRHYKIQEVIKRRQILLVQVTKEERGNKGAALTTYLSLAGRYSVLMPNTARGGGISRKITNAADRKRLKGIAGKLDVPQGMGVILRTAGAARTAAEIQRDFEYLMRLWENVRTLTLESTAPCLVYEEGSLIKRSIRDLYDKETSEILVAGAEGYREAKDFMQMLMPSHARNVKLYKERVPIFARSGVEAQLDAMLQPQVTLKSGGYLIINQTEALVAIDVNSGRSTRQHSVEETAVQTNLEAADEVGRQLRLRDLAGLIVIDFIDMDNRSNVRKVENRLKDALREDRARIQVGRISHFGLMEMSRQRMRSSVLESTTQTCPTCDGLGYVRSSSSVVLQALRAIEEQLNKNARADLDVKVHTPTAIHMLNSKRDSVSDLEERFGVTITVGIDDHIGNVPCTIERGAQATRRPTAQAVQVDGIDPDTEEVGEAQVGDVVAMTEPDEQAEGRSDEDNSDGSRKRRRRRRRGGSNDEASEAEVASANEDAASEVAADTPADEEEKPKRTRRRRKKADETDENTSAESSETPKAEETLANEPEEADDKPKRKRVTRKAPPSPKQSEAQAEQAEASEKSDEQSPLRRSRRTTRRKVEDGDDGAEQSEPAAEQSSEPNSSDGDDGKKKKGGWWQRRFF
jgi:ribonuclease E